MNFFNVRFAGFGLGLPFLLFGLFSVVSALNSTNWEFVEGIVSVSSRVGFRPVSLDLKVDYKVDGSNLKCNRVAFGSIPDPRDDYRYYVGAKVRVYYNNQDPSECVLEPGISGTLVIIFLIGFSLSMAGLYAHGKIKSDLGLITNNFKENLIAENTLENAYQLADSGNLIEAIKVYRAVTGKGLKESKNDIESYLQKSNDKYKH